MGSSPKAIEARGIALLENTTGGDFDIQFGHEVTADAFLRLKWSSGARGPEPGWLPVQIKVTSHRTKEWERKMRYVLRTQRDSLHGATLLGVSLNKADCWFVHVVHRHTPYESFCMGDPAWNYEPALVSECLRDHWQSRAASLYKEPSRAFAYSKETLLEVDARAAFVDLLRGTDLDYQVCREEFSGVGGHLFLRSAPHKKYRIQEKLLSWRLEDGEALGLRTKLRRASGKNYKAADGDYFLLHARGGTPGACEPFSLFGSALVPFHELEARGMLRKNDQNPGTSILALYPAGCPGVKNGRTGWLEKCFKPKEELVAYLTDELRSRNGFTHNRAECETFCAMQ
eukprot:g14940.t1